MSANIHKPNFLLIFCINCFFVANISATNLINSISTETKKHNFENKIIQLNARNKNINLELNPSINADSFGFSLCHVDNFPYYSTFPEKSYTNLPGGEHELFVWAVKNKISTDTTIIKINVVTTMFEASWYRPSLLIYLALLGLGIAFFWLQYDFRQKEKVTKFRTNLTAELHDEVGSSLTSIIVFSKLLKRKIPENMNNIQEITQDVIETSQNAINNLRDTVSILHPEKDNLYELIEKIRSHAIKNIKAKDINIDFSVDFDEKILEKLKKSKINLDRTRDIFLIFKELINNIIKHSNAENVKIDLFFSSFELKIIIKDDGVGFNTDTNFSGYGLTSMKQRADESTILIKTTSEKNKGTNTTLEIPIFR